MSEYLSSIGNNKINLHMFSVLCLHWCGEKHRSAKVCLCALVWWRDCRKAQDNRGMSVCTSVMRSAQEGGGMSMCTGAARKA